MFYKANFISRPMVQRVLACFGKFSFTWRPDLYDLIHASPAQAYKKFTNKTGRECSRGEGSVTWKDANLMKQYVDKYNGQEIDIEPHVKNSVKESAPRFVRLHFAHDPTITNRILIGHCGKHLDNYSTRKVK